MTSDESLLKACASGDNRAWRQLVDRYARLVYSIPLNFGLSPADADDVAQMTFSALLQGLDGITDAGRLSSWLITVARRQTWRYVERQRREPTPDADADERDTPAEDDPVVGRRLEDMEWLHQGLVRLDPRCHQLLGALYFSSEARPYTEVAEELGMPVGSIGPTRARCLDKLRVLLTDLETS